MGHKYQQQSGITIYEVPQPFVTFVFVDLLQHMKYVFSKKKLLTWPGSWLKSVKHLKWFLILRLCGSKLRTDWKEFKSSKICVTWINSEIPSRNFKHFRNLPIWLLLTSISKPTFFKQKKRFGKSSPISIHFHPCPSLPTDDQDAYPIPRMLSPQSAVPRPENCFHLTKVFRTVDGLMASEIPRPTTVWMYKNPCK